MSLLHVEADYELKKVGAGFSRMPGVASSFEQRKISPCDGSGAYSASHRNWFTPLYPERPRFFEDDNAVWIHKPVMVQLQTEEEFLRGCLQDDELSKMLAPNVVN